MEVKGLRGLTRKENDMPGKLNGSAKWVGIGLTIVLLIANLIWQSATISGSVSRHERRIDSINRRIDKDEAVILTIKEKLVEIANNQKWMMKNLGKK